jgi:hypothetical protein
MECAHGLYPARPGAKAIASEAEWQSVGRHVLPDAVPIIILWPFSPIWYVYELADTGPIINREQIGDPFAAVGTFDAKVLPNIIGNLHKQKTFKVVVEYRRQGFQYTGSAAAQGTLPGIASGGLSVSGQCTIGQFAASNADTPDPSRQGRIPIYRVTLKDRLDEKERFVTLCHRTRSHLLRSSPT